MSTMRSQQSSSDTPALPPPPSTSYLPEARSGTAPTRWSLGRKILAVVLLVVVAGGAIIGLLAWNSNRQVRAAREQFAGVYVNSFGDKIVLRPDGGYDLEGYTMEGVAGEWELYEYRTIPIGSFEPKRLFIPFSREVGGDAQTGWVYLIGPDGRTLIREHDGVASTDAHDRYVRTKDL